MTCRPRRTLLAGGNSSFHGCRLSQAERVPVDAEMAAFDRLPPGQRDTMRRFALDACAAAHLRLVRAVGPDASADALDGLGRKIAAEAARIARESLRPPPRAPGATCIPGATPSQRGRP